MPEYITDGDQGFVGVNMNLDPALLEPGHAAEAINKRFKNGVARTRPGLVKLNWSNLAKADYENKTYAENDIVRYSGRKATSITGTSPNQTFTTAIVSDGFDFASGYNFEADPGGWTKGTGWTINTSANKATSDGSQSALSNLTHAIDTAPGHAYKVTFTILDYSGGTLEPFLGNADNGISPVSGNGTHTVVLTTSNPEDTIHLQASADFVGSVKDVKLCEPAQVQQNANTGPASNPFIGPYFKRTSVATHTHPAASYALVNNVETWTVSSSWTDLGSRIFPFSTVYGAGVFNDPNNEEYVIIATSDGIYATSEGFLTFKLPGLASVDRDVTFVQAFNQMVMFRGENQAPMVMADLAKGFVSVTQEDTDLSIEDNDFDGTDTIPNAENGIYFQNRLLIPHQRDLVAASDYLNVTRYQPVLSNFRINQGSEDKLVALHKFDASTVICFKSSSIYMVRNIYGNLTDIVLDELTNAYGCFAAKSIASVGRDVWFLSDKRGICSLGITQSGAVQGADEPVSRPIQPIIDRINWNAAHKAVSAYNQNRFYCALPIDGSDSLNVIVCYDFLSGAWAGMDQGIKDSSDFKVKEFIQPKIAGRKRLCFLDENNTINLYDDEEYGGVVDQTLNADGSLTNYNIEDKLVSRGYNLKNMERKHWHAARVCAQSLNPSFTVRATVDGAEETETVKGPITFDRTKYDKPFYQADFVATNVNQDFSTKYRQDYSISLAEDGSTAAGQLWLSKDNADGPGVFPDLHQESQNKVRLKADGRYVQIDVRNTQGSLKISSILVDGLQDKMNLNKDT
tara:strand:- start:1784 stop:4177 length:2394 start_codon:yes stop_codon:yes gene_type:complete